MLFRLNLMSWGPLYWGACYRPYYAPSSRRGITTWYSETHEYIQYDSTTKMGRCGLTKYGANEIRDITFCSFPKVGEELRIDDTVCELENSKDFFNVLSPVDGEITKLNANVIENLHGIIVCPETKGWIWQMKVTKLAENLMNAKQYEKFCTKI